LSLEKKKGELFNYTQQVGLFERSKKEQTQWNKTVNTLSAEVQKLETDIEEIKSNKIYENAFEWRFEFPEVLNDAGDFVGFDVVIGNPPYVNFANLPHFEREYYNKFKLYKNKTDLYAFFVGLGSQIKSKTGLICVIVPHTWVSTSSFLPLRKLLFNELFIDKIVELDFGVFKDAYVKTVILQTDSKSHNSVKIFDENFKLKVLIPNDVILLDEELKINLTWSSRNHEIYLKLKKDAIELGQIIHFSRGIKTSNDSKFLSKENKGEDFYKVIRGRNIKAYTINYVDEYIWYRPDIMKEKTGCLPHSKELFLKGEKIVTQRINSSGQLLATLDTEKYFCLDTTNISTEIFDSNYDLKFIVGIMNSKLINWWFNDVFKNPTISGYELHQIPIKYNIHLMNKISQLVYSILKTKNNIQNTNFLMQSIDQLVYELYGLTDEEIGVVEGD
jgi:hypothetical protein